MNKKYKDPIINEYKPTFGVTIHNLDMCVNRKYDFKNAFIKISYKDAKQLYEIFKKQFGKKMEKCK